MDSNTVAVVSVITTGAVGLIASGATVILGWRSRLHEVRMARENREFERTADSYVDLLTWIRKFSAFTREFDAGRNSDPTQRPTGLPDTDDWGLSASVRVELFGSQAVRAAYEEYMKNVFAVGSAAEALLRQAVGQQSAGSLKLDPAVVAHDKEAARLMTNVLRSEIGALTQSPRGARWWQRRQEKRAG